MKKQSISLKRVSVLVGVVALTSLAWRCTPTQETANPPVAPATATAATACAGDGSGQVAELTNKLKAAEARVKAAEGQLGQLTEKKPEWDAAVTTVASLQKTKNGRLCVPVEPVVASHTRRKRTNIVAQKGETPGKEGGGRMVPPGGEDPTVTEEEDPPPAGKTPAVTPADVRGWRNQLATVKADCTKKIPIKMASNKAESDRYDQLLENIKKGPSTGSCAPADTSPVCHAITTFFKAAPQAPTAPAAKPAPEPKRAQQLSLIAGLVQDAKDKRERELAALKRKCASEIATLTVRIEQAKVVKEPSKAVAATEAPPKAAVPAAIDE